jgi:D-glycero-alpha-D-manno-heptose 1-phosphate guanylyltransferase
MIIRRPREMLILAGGMGTRLRSVVDDVPKPMAPVLGKPFLKYLLDYWIEQGVNRFVLAVGYRGDSIIEHFGESYRSAKLSYVHESCPLGTGGAIRMALQETTWGGDYILLSNGDTWFEVDLPQFTLDANQCSKPVTIALKVIQVNDRYSGVELNDRGLISNFGVESQKSCVINGGCYLLDITFISQFLRHFPDMFSFEEEVLKPLAAVNQIASSLQNHVFLDIGVPEDYRKATDVVGHYQSRARTA